MVPPLADCRQPRTEDADLAAASASGRPAVACQVVTGLGGVGKTQLAAALAHRYWDTNAVELLVWVAASSRSRVLSAYAQVAADLSGVDDQDLEQAAARLLAWLAGTDRRWLIVLDDLTDPADLRGLWPPAQTRVGRTVVTTRRRDASLLAGRHVVPVGLFTPGEARAYLDHKLAGHPDLLDGAGGLATDLGYLPLALAQAAAYLLDRNLTCSEYRRRLADRRRRLADLVPEDGALPDEHQATVAAAWALSIELADQLHPTGLARPLIALAALLDSNGIPDTLFITEEVVGYLTARLVGQRRVDAAAVRDGLYALHRLNLVIVDTDTVRVHALVQRAVREATPADQLAELATTAADALLTLWPATDHATTTQVATLRANTTILAGSAGDILWHSAGHPLLYRAGDSLLSAGLHALAILYWRDMTHVAARVLGDDHPDTLTARSNLASSYWQAGRTAEAVAIQENLVVTSARVLGAEHRSTLINRGNLAASYRHTGRTTEAISIQEEVAGIAARVLGDDHPDTLMACNNLATSYLHGGRPAEAIAIQKKVLADRVLTLGAEHPDTLAVRSNLAASYWHVGRTVEAITIQEEVAGIAARVLGNDHPDTLTARSNLASSYWQAGRTAEAITIEEEIVAASARVHGDRHPDTLRVRGNLAVSYRHAGRVDEAIALMEEVLTARVQVRGEEHLDTIIARTLLAASYLQAERTKEAITLMEKVVDASVRVLGEQHPETLAAKEALRRWQADA